MARATNDFFSRPSNPAFNPDLVAKYAPPLDTPATLGKRHADPSRAGTPESNREAHRLLTGWAREGRWFNALAFCREWIGCRAYWREGDAKGRSLRPGRAFLRGGPPVPPETLAADREVALWKFLQPQGPRLRIKWWSDSVRCLEDAPPDDCRAYLLRAIYGGYGVESESSREAVRSYKSERREPGTVSMSPWTDREAPRETEVVYPTPHVPPLAKPLLDAFSAAWNAGEEVSLLDMARRLWPEDAYRRREAVRHFRRAWKWDYPFKARKAAPRFKGAETGGCPARMRAIGVPYKVRLAFSSTDPMPYLKWTVGKPMERIVPGPAPRELGEPRRRHVRAFAETQGVSEADVRVWIKGEPEPEYDAQLDEERERSRVRLARAIAERPWLIPYKERVRADEYTPERWSLFSEGGMAPQYVPTGAGIDWYERREAQLVLEYNRTAHETSPVSKPALIAYEALSRVRAYLRENAPIKERVTRLDMQFFSDRLT